MRVCVCVCVCVRACVRECREREREREEREEQERVCSVCMCVCVCGANLNPRINLAIGMKGKCVCQGGRGTERETEELLRGREGHRQGAREWKDRQIDTNAGSKYDRTFMWRNDMYV